MKKSKILANGIILENPVFRLALGTCPTLAVTTTALNGISMGLAATFVLICSNVFISLLRKIIPDRVRIPAYVIIIATFVTLVEMIMRKFMYSLYENLGLFLPLIVVNCVILARAEAFASKNPVVDSAVDGLGMGLGFTLALTILGFIRELVGSGTFFGLNLGFSDNAMIVFILPAGGFLTFGLVMALINHIMAKIDERRNSNSANMQEVLAPALETANATRATNVGQTYTTNPAEQIIENTVKATEKDYNESAKQVADKLHENSKIDKKNNLTKEDNK